MSVEKKEQSCALCHAYLFPEDDVVYCPECGAPHHRECYNSIGKCALEEFHGTENQYDKLKRAEEEKQAEETKEEQPQQDFNPQFPGFTAIDFLGGVKPDDEIDEGVTARDAAKCVYSNTMRYIPKFMNLKQNKASWNFLAFLFPAGWFLSRKMYKGGIITATVQIIATLLTVPFQTVLINLGMNSMVSTTEMMQKLADNMDKIPPIAVLLSFISVIVMFALRILSGIFGDWFYKKHIVEVVRKVNAESTNKELDLRKKGGVNLFLFLLGFFAVQYIPAIIVMFI